MKTIALVTASLIAPLSTLAPAQSADALRAKCAEQERQIKQLEKEIDSLHALLGKEGSKKAAPNMVAAQTSGFYKVQKGDTLSKIARKHGVSLGDMLSANKGINANRLNIGQEIKIPGATPSKASTAVAVAEPTPKASSTNAVSSYTIKGGDTLYSIARAHGTSVTAITACNDKLDARSLNVGQRISLPASGSHSAPKAKAETKPAVAKKESAPKSAPAVAKQSTPKPAVAKSEPAPAPKKRESIQQVSHSPQQPKVRTVTVNQQMTYGQFASMHGVSIDQVNELNGLTLTKSTVLAQGSELYIPGAGN